MHRRIVPGIESERLLYLHDRCDSRSPWGSSRCGEDLLILGGGFIGCEVAAAARLIKVLNARRRDRHGLQRCGRGRCSSRRRAPRA